MSVAAPAYPRDFRGYGRNPPDPRWPGNARVAVQFVVNFEEGGENNVLDGDRASEAFLSDVLGAQPWPGQRHANIESMFEYGSRAGFWRLWRMFGERNWPTTVFGVATALKRNPEIVAAMKESGWDIASHSLKWIEHKDMSESEERVEIAAAIRIHTEATGAPPLGWYTGRDSPNTRRLVVEHGGYEYDSDYYGDDLPFWAEVEKGDGTQAPHLVVPYSLDTNDMRFVQAQDVTDKADYDPAWIPAYTRDGFERIQKLRLTVAEAQFASQFNGSRSIAQIARNLRLDLKFARLTLFRFVELEIVECWPPGASESAERGSVLKRLGRSIGIGD